VRQITFYELADYLMHGREIEFRYEGREYSITNSHHEWNFCCDTDGTVITLCGFPEFDILVEKVRGIEIDGVSVERIFSGHPPGDLEVLDIL